MEKKGKNIYFGQKTFDEAFDKAFNKFLLEDKIKSDDKKNKKNIRSPKIKLLLSINFKTIVNKEKKLIRIL